MAKITFKLSTMVGRNLEFHYSEMAKIPFKLSMVGGKLEFHYSEMAKIRYKLSTMVGGNLVFH